MSLIRTVNVTPIRCHRCKWQWDYTGKNEWYATCPHCRTYTSVIRNAIRSEPKLGGVTHPLSITKGAINANG